MSEIREEILRYLQKIPKGKVMTYKTLADMFGVHPRKVAMTMKYNRFPEVYPCYKVISHSGKVSGYSGTDGVDGKIQKLKNDGIEVVNGKIESKYIM